MTAATEVGPEVDALLGVLGLSIPGAVVDDYLSVAARSFNPGAFADYAAYHRINRVALEAIDGGVDGVPSDQVDSVRAELNRAALPSLAWGMELVRALDAVDRRLREDDIEFLVLKGPVLSQLLYDDPVMREFGDLDLLIKPSSAADAEAALSDIGFRPSGSLHGGREPSWHRNLLDERGRLIELHTQVDRAAVRWPDSIESLFDRGRTVEVEDIRLPTLGPEDNILYTALHGVRHRWKRLQWVQDLRTALRVERVDLHDLAQTTGQFGIERRFTISMALLEALGDERAVQFGTEERLDRPTRRLVRKMLVKLLTGSDRKEHPVRRVWTDIKMADPGDTVGHVLRTIGGVTIR